MNIFEIIIPGTKLADPNRECAWKHEQCLDALRSQFYTANGALHRFLTAANTRIVSEEQWDADTQRRWEISRQLEADSTAQGNRTGREQLDFKAEILFKREQWQQRGRVPWEFEQKARLIDARAFVAALDAFTKILGVLSKEEGAPEEVSRLHRQLEKEFPALKDVRNTMQHVEDRARGVDRHRKPIQLQPLQNGIIDAPHTGVLMLDNLTGTTYQCTMENGHVGSVEVSAESMEKLQSILQHVVNAFQWTGRKQHYPSL